MTSQVNRRWSAAEDCGYCSIPRQFNILIQILLRCTSILLCLSFILKRDLNGTRFLRSRCFIFLNVSVEDLELNEVKQMLCTSSCTVAFYWSRLKKKILWVPSPTFVSYMKVKVNLFWFWTVEIYRCHLGHWHIFSSTILLTFWKCKRWIPKRIDSLKTHFSTCSLSVQNELKLVWSVFIWPEHRWSSETRKCMWSKAQRTFT